MPITILRAQRGSLCHRREAVSLGERAITSFECTRHVNVDTREPVRTIDPVVFGDVRAYVVLVGRRAEGACEGRVFAQEV